MTRSRLLQAGLLLTGFLVLAACAAGPNSSAAHHGAGFWLGLWQGVICPITFLVSLFNDHVNIYDIHNNGNWYNFGYVIGISVAFSGAARSGRAARPRSKASR